jgi:ethanolamine utilization protein EutA
MNDEDGGRVFFSNAGRSLEGEDEIVLSSVGVDIGSSTSHLVFSRLVMERADNRYIVAAREILHESDILLTPYTSDDDIDTAALGTFIAQQYQRANLTPDDIDTGALILTGVAVRRRNARAIGDLFAEQAGKFVAVSAGDGLETTLAAYGAGAVSRSLRTPARVMNIDIGGGTAKIAVCESGAITTVTAIDIGARLIAFDETLRLTRIEPGGQRFAEELGHTIKLGDQLAPATLDAIADRMAARLFEAVSSQSLSPQTAALLRLPPLDNAARPDIVTFSGGVSEFIYGHQHAAFGDLGPHLAAAIRRRVEAWSPRIEPPAETIRATVVGAAQYTVQVSGSTIYIRPETLLPVRNIAAIVPNLDLAPETLDIAAIAQSIRATLQRLDLQDGHRPVALCYHWQGSATFWRLDAFCRGFAAGLEALTAQGHPVILVGDGDIGGLVGIHLIEEAGFDLPVISIDGVTMKEFDFIDIGALLPASGAVPVVIKSLVFPATAALGRAAA